MKVIKKIIITIMLLAWLHSAYADFDVSSGILLDRIQVETSQICGADISNDGTTLTYIKVASPAVLYEYTLTTPWDLSTKTLNNSKTMESSDCFGGYTYDGLHYYVVNSSTNKLKHYTLGTAWDISTQTSEQIDTTTFSAGDIWDWDCDTSGEHCYAIYAIWGSTYIRHYTMGTPYDITTISLSEETTTWNSPFIMGSVSQSWEYIFIWANSYDWVYQYSLSTPYDVSTSSLYKSLQISGSNNGAGNPWFTTNNKMIVSDIQVGPWDVSIYDSFSGSLEPPEPENITCTEEYLNYSYPSGIEVQNIDVDNSYWDTTWYWLNERYPFYFYNDSDNYVFSGYNIWILPVPVDYSGTLSVDRANLKNLTNSWSMYVDTLSYLTSPIDYTSIQWFKLETNLAIEISNILIESPDDFQFYLYDKNFTKIWNQKYNTNETVFMEGLGYNTVYVWLDTSAMVKTYNITWIRFGEIAQQWFTREVCTNTTTWDITVDGTPVTPEELEELQDFSPPRDTDTEIYTDGLYSSGSLVFGLSLGTVAPNTSWLDEDCEPIFDENWDFNYIKEGTVWTFIATLSSGNAYTLGDRWELIIFDTNVIWWIYDFVNFLIKKLQEIAWFIIDTTIGTLLDFFSVLMVPEREQNYCFLGVNMYLESNIDSYYSFKDKEQKNVVDKNAIEYIIMIMLSFFILKYIFKFI